MGGQNNEALLDQQGFSITQPSPSESRLDADPHCDVLPDARVHDYERLFPTMKQYRVIFKEVCRAVGDLEFLGEVIDVLGQALIRKSSSLLTAPIC